MAKIIGKRTARVDGRVKAIYDEREPETNLATVSDKAFATAGEDKQPIPRGNPSEALRM